MDLIPQSGPHLHILLNHFPSVGFVIGTGFFVAGILAGNALMKRACLVLFVILGVLAIPIYISGAAAMWALDGDPSYPRSLINAHRDAALLAFIGLGITGSLAWIVIWRERQGAGQPAASIYGVLVLAALTLFLMARAGHRGGFINHAEIRSESGLAISDENIGHSVDLENGFNDIVWSFPAMETLHFLGMAMIFGAVLVLTLRVLGFAKAIPFAGVHRLLPLGLAGLIINSVSGMLLFISDSGRYAAMPGFPPKIAALVIATLVMLYFSLSERLWRMRSGDDAPPGAKAVAAFALAAWLGVIVLGRALPYTEY